MGGRSDDSATTQSASSGRTKGEPYRALLVFADGEPVLHRLPDLNEITVGRGGDVTVRIDDSRLSRRHARIGIGAHVTIEDLGSANGTFVAGTRLERGKTALVAPGTPIELGGVVIVVHIGATSVPTILSETDGDASRGRALERLVERVATSSLPVLLVGEAGTGKSFLARRIHDRSRRAAGPFVTMGPSALGRAAADPRELAVARGGTLVLDDVIEVPVGAQRELARHIEAEGDAVRVLASTQRDAVAALEGQRFVAELHQRIAGVTIVVPPLRARTREVGPLAMLFAVEAAHRAGRASPIFAPDALIALERYRWPGNVRELRAVVERAVVLGIGRVITASMLPDLARNDAAPERGGERGGALREVRDDAEYQRIMEALRACGGNQTQASRALGISRSTLIARLDRFRVPRPRK